MLREFLFKRFHLSSKQITSMNIKTEKTAIAKNLKRLKDPELILSIKNLINYGISKQKEQDVYNIPESHKRIVRARIKSLKKDELLDWDKVQNKFRI